MDTYIVGSRSVKILTPVGHYRKMRQMSLWIHGDIALIVAGGIRAKIMRGGREVSKQKRITTSMAGKLIGVSPGCIQQNMRNGNLPIGFYTGESGRDYFYISPIKLMMFTGIKKEAIERICEIDLSDYMESEDWQVVEGALQKWKDLVFGKGGPPCGSTMTT